MPNETIISKGKPVHLATVVSGFNSTSSALLAGATFTGEYENVTGFTSVITSLKSSASCTLHIDFSPDGTNTDSTLSFDVAADSNEVHRITISKKFFRIRIANGSTAQTYLRAQSIFGNHQLLTSSLNSTLQSDADAIATRSVLFGASDDGNYRQVNVSGEGHLEAEIHGPLLPFGSIHTENMTPELQSDFVYGVTNWMNSTVNSLSGSVTETNSLATCATGTTIYSQGVLQSRKRLRYRSGQGMVMRFTGMWSAPANNSYAILGLGHPEDGYYVGYKNLDFGFLRIHGGLREIRTLTLSSASSTNENVTVTLNGTAYLIPVTNSANINRTAYEISIGNFGGSWRAQQVGSTVVFVSGTAAALAGAFTLAGTTAAGTFATTRVGQATTEVHVAQSDWNGDKLDGTGPSGVTLDKTKLNIFQISLQYLGAGTATLMAFVCSADGNNPTWVVCHSFKNPNTLTLPHIKNPSLPFLMAAYSAGSTTNISVSCASYAGFIEGVKKLNGPRFTYFNSITTATAAALHCLFTIRNDSVYAGKANQTIVNIMSLMGAVKHTSPVVYYLIRNGTLAGNVNFTKLSTSSSTSWDTAATTVTYSDNYQLIWTGHLGDTGELDHHYSINGLEEVTLQPNEWVTLAVRSVTGSPSYVTGSINTREDQ